MPKRDPYYPTQHTTTIYPRRHVRDEPVEPAWPQAVADAPATAIVELAPNPASSGGSPPRVSRWRRLLGLSLLILMVCLPGCAQLRTQFDQTDALALRGEALEAVIDIVRHASKVRCIPGEKAYVVAEYDPGNGVARGVIRCQ